LADAGACRGRNTLLHRWVVSPFSLTFHCRCPTPRTTTPHEHPSAGNPGEILPMFMLGNVVFACSLLHCTSGERRGPGRQQLARGSISTQHCLQTPKSSAQTRLPVSDAPLGTKKCLVRGGKCRCHAPRLSTSISASRPTSCATTKQPAPPQAAPPQTGLGCLSNSQMLSSRARAIEQHPQLSAQEALRLLRSMPPPPPHSFFHSISPPPPSLLLLLSVCLSQQHHPKDFYESSSACQKRIVSIPLAPAARLPDAEYRILSLAARTKGGPYLQLYVDR
jgi:hypothetical protein